MPFQILRNDITKMVADAIVNTANPEPTYASGTDLAIYEAAGAEKLLAERRKLGRIEPGQAAVTKAFSLPAKMIIHTVGPVWKGGSCHEEEILGNCYRNSLKLAKEKKCSSIAFPLISSGVYGFPKDLALKCAVSAISDFLLKEEMLVYLVVFDKKAFVLSGKIFSDVDAFIDDRYVEHKKRKEYPHSDFSVAGNAGRREEMRPFMAASMPFPKEAAQKAPSFAPSFAGKKKTLEEVVKQRQETFQQRLFRLIDERGMTDVEVYKKANLDKKLFSKIRSNCNYQPKKPTAIALAISLGLNLDETKDFLGRAGYALSPSSISDLIVEYFIDRRVYDMYTINLALFEHDQPTLGV